MKYPEEYRQGYINTALNKDDMFVQAVEAGYKHFYNAMTDLLSGLSVSDMPLMICVMHKQIKLALKIKPDAEELAAKLEKVIDHEVRYMVLPNPALLDGDKK